MVATSWRREVALVGRPEGARHHGVDRHTGVAPRRAMAPAAAIDSSTDIRTLRWL